MYRALASDVFENVAPGEGYNCLGKGGEGIWTLALVIVGVNM